MRRDEGERCQKNGGKRSRDAAGANEDRFEGFSRKLPPIAVLSWVRRCCRRVSVAFLLSSLERRKVQIAAAMNFCRVAIFLKPGAEIAFTKTSQKGPFAAAVEAFPISRRAKTAFQNVLR